MRSVHLANGAEPLLALYDKASYLTDPSYAGTVIAPAAGRIRNAELTIHSKIFHLTKNEPHATLHSGMQSTARQTWDVVNISEQKVVFRIYQPDGLDGFPGGRTITTEYQLNGKKIIALVTCATDAPTYFNPTIHSYWNCTPGKGALDNLLTIPAQTFWINDADFIPDKIQSVEAYRSFDFRAPVSLNQAMQQADTLHQLTDGRGYNNAFNASEATLSSADLAVHFITDAPCVWLYSGGYLDRSTQLSLHTTSRIKPVPAFPSCGIALEAQDCSMRITEPGAPFTRTFTFELDWQ